MPDKKKKKQKQKQKRQRGGGKAADQNGEKGFTKVINCNCTQSVRRKTFPLMYREKANECAVVRHFNVNFAVSQSGYGLSAYSGGFFFFFFFVFVFVFFLMGIGALESREGVDCYVIRVGVGVGAEMLIKHANSDILQTLM